MAENDDRTKVSELLKKFRFAMFTTVDESGKLVSRPMTVQDREFDGDLWFFAAKDSDDVKQIGGDAQVNVSFSSNDTWLSLSGTAETVDDAVKVHELWNPYVEAWFPKGENDANVTLIRFSPDTAQYWDTPGGRVASVIAFVKSKVSGSTPDVGETGTTTV
jgi:general stress protein 26